MISYNEILKVIEAFADGHKFKPRFYAEFEEQLPNLATEDIEFPVIFCSPTNGDTLENVEVTEVEIYCLDRLRKDRKNTNDVVSDTKQILSQDLTRWLEEGQQDVEIERAYSCSALYCCPLLEVFPCRLSLLFQEFQRHQLLKHLRSM